MFRVIVRSGRRLVVTWGIGTEEALTVHKAKSITEYLFDIGLDTMDWLARSPDLNLIENVWGLMACEVYGQCKQFDTKEELLDAIKKAAKKVTREYLHKLHHSIPIRAMKVIEVRIRQTKY